MKTLISVVSVFAAASALAVAIPAGKTMTFSTVGPDTYADGTPVMKGESYALCWSSDGNFEGIAADGTPIDANDRVVCTLPYATDEITGVMHCPPVIFQVLAPEYDGGQFDVYLLDTRKYSEDGKVTVGKQGGVLAVAKAQKAKAKLTVTNSGAAPIASVSEAGVSASETTALPAGYKAGKVKVTDMQVNADYVTIKVENTVPYLNYAATTSESLGGEGTVGNPVTGKAGEPIYIVVPNTGKAGFFSVNRK